MSGLSPINSQVQQIQRNLSTGTNQNSTSRASAYRLQSEAKSATVGVSNGSLAMARMQTSANTLNQVGDAVSRLGSLASRASDPTLSDADRSALNTEAQQLTSEINDTFSNAKFNGQSILDGSTVNTNINGQVSLQDADGSAITGALAGLDLSTEAGAATALAQVEGATGALGDAMATVGASQGAAGRAINAAHNKAAAMDMAASEMSGVDVAEEAGKLKQAATQSKIANSVTKMQNDMQKETLKFFQ